MAKGYVGIAIIHTVVFGKNMLKDFLLDYKKIPAIVLFEHVNEFAKFEERFFDIEGAFGDIVGMLENAVEFCPNNVPPTQEEILAWLWIIKPELKIEILKIADEELKEIIENSDN